MILAMRSEARSTSGNQSLQAVIDLVRHNSINSPMSSKACAGTQPSECEIRCTQSLSEGNLSRHTKRESAAIVMRLLCRCLPSLPRRPRCLSRASTHCAGPYTDSRDDRPNQPKRRNPPPAATTGHRSTCWRTRHQAGLVPNAENEKGQLSLTFSFIKFGTPKGIRTPVTAVKRRCPRPG